MNLQGKTAIVTGGSRGIGRAVSERLGGAGAAVIVNYLTSKDAAETFPATSPAPGTSTQSTPRSASPHAT